MGVKWSIIPAKTALIVHDMVNEMVDEKGLFFDPSVKKVQQNIIKLIGECREKNVTIVYAVPGQKSAEDFGRIGDFYPELISHNTMTAGSWGASVHASISPTKGDVIIRKNRIGAFYGSNLHRILKRRGIDTVIVSGVSTSVGCDTTARDATNRDYKTIFVSDGCLSRPMADQGWGNITGEDVARVHLSSLAKAFAMVVTTQQVADLIRRS